MHHQLEFVVLIAKNIKAAFLYPCNAVQHFLAFTNKLKIIPYRINLTETWIRRSFSKLFKMAQPPLRVISLLPSATDTVVALGLESLLVGRSHEVNKGFIHSPRKNINNHRPLLNIIIH